LASPFQFAAEAVKRVMTGVFDPTFANPVETEQEPSEQRRHKTFVVEAEAPEAMSSSFADFSPIRAMPPLERVHQQPPESEPATPVAVPEPVRMIPSPWGGLVPSMIDLLEQGAEMDRFNDSLAGLSINESSFVRRKPERRSLAAAAAQAAARTPPPPLVSFYERAQKSPSLLDVADPPDAEEARKRVQLVQQRLEEHWAWARRVEEEKSGGRAAPVRDLTPAEAAVYDEAMRKGPETAVVTQASVKARLDTELSKGDIWRLKPAQWLNDESINLYMKMIQKRADDAGVELLCLNSFFYGFLTKNGYEKVRRWSKNKDLFAGKMRVMFPVHLGNHWCLGVINFRDKRLEYYDSLFGANPECVQAMREYVNREHLDKKKRPFDWSGWGADVINPSNLPRQENGSDCGVFAAMFAESLSRGEFPSFSQAEMGKLRRIMTVELVMGTFVTHH
jgi:sentrin-specific protease 1